MFTYSLTVLLPLVKEQLARRGRSSLQLIINNSLILNLIVCQKKQLTLGRISLLKRKAQHRRKRIQRKKHGKVKNSEGPVHSTGLLFTPLLKFWFKTSSTKSSLQRLIQPRKRIEYRAIRHIISVSENCAQRLSACRCTGIRGSSA